MTIKIKAAINRSPWVFRVILNFFPLPPLSPTILFFTVYSKYLFIYWSSFTIDILRFFVFALVSSLNLKILLYTLRGWSSIVFFLLYLSFFVSIPSGDNFPTKRNLGIELGCRITRFVITILHHNKIVLIFLDFLSVQLST